MIQYDVVLNFVTKMNGGSPAKMIDKSVTPVVALKKAFSQMMDLERFKDMGMNLQDYNTEMAKVRNTVTNLGGDFNKMNSNAKKMSKRFDMSMMSVMFFGMQIQKTFTMVFNSMLNTFKMLDKKGVMPLNRALTKMEAAFTFLSFAVMKAMEPILLPIIDAIVGLVDWFSQLPTPVLQAVGTLTILGATLGGMMYAVGTISLGLEGINTALLGIGGATGATGVLTTLEGLLWPVAAALLWITWILEDVKNNSASWEKAFNSVGLAINDLVSAFVGSEVDVSQAGDFIGKVFLLSSAIAGIAIRGIIYQIGALIDALLGLSYAMQFKFGDAAVSFGKALKTEMDFLADSESVIDKTMKKIMDIKEKVYAEPTTGPVNAKVGADILLGKNTNDFFNTGKSQFDNYAKGVSSSSHLIQQSVLMCSKPITNTLGSTALPTTGPLANVPQQGYNLMSAYSAKVTEASPLLNTTMQTVFNSAGKTMYDTNHYWVEQTISDVNRALAKLRELENKRKEESKATSVTNNNKSVVVNVKGSDNTKLVTDIKKAVAL
jgi:hypothetical protein